jgi:hypothetical protein
MSRTPHEAIWWDNSLKLHTSFPLSRKKAPGGVLKFCVEPSIQPKLRVNVSNLINQWNKMGHALLCEFCHHCDITSYVAVLATSIYAMWFTASVWYLKMLLDTQTALVPFTWVPKLHPIIHTLHYKHVPLERIYCLMYCPGQNKGIALFLFFDGCRKRWLEDSDTTRTAIRLR